MEHGYYWCRHKGYERLRILEWDELTGYFYSCGVSARFEANSIEVLTGPLQPPVKAEQTHQRETRQWLHRVLSMPFREKAELDFEFYNDRGELCGSVTSPLAVRINSFGVIVQASYVFYAMEDTMLAGYGVWFGNGYHSGPIVPPRMMHKGDGYTQLFNVPVVLGETFDLGWDPDKAPEPTPAPIKGSQKV